MHTLATTTDRAADTRTLVPRNGVSGEKHWLNSKTVSVNTRPLLSNNALICVVDHDYKTRRDVLLLFQSHKSQVESFPSGEAFLNRPIHNGPCCLVMDVQASGLSGVDLLQIISNASRTEQMIFVSAHHDNASCAQAFKAGAVDFLSKPLKDAELIQAIKCALIRSEEALLRRGEMQLAQSLIDQLTPREREVLGLVISGKLNKEIAADLGTTEKTIKKHRGQIMRKLKVGSLAELVHFTHVSGLRPSCPYGGLRSHIQG